MIAVEFVPGFKQFEVTFGFSCFIVNCFPDASNRLRTGGHRCDEGEKNNAAEFFHRFKFGQKYRALQKKSLAACMDTLGKALSVAVGINPYTPASFFKSVFNFLSFGRFLPCEPRLILPFFDLKSPLPMGGFVIFVSESEITGSKSNKMFLKGKRKNGFGNFPEAVEAS